MQQDQATPVDVVVVGAGQAGLSAAGPLRRAGVETVVLDGDAGPGGAWRHRWPTLTWRRVHGLHPLPGLGVPEADPEAPVADVVPPWFAEYERALDLRVRRPARVRAVRRADDDRLLVESTAGTWAARAVVNATGTWSRPFRPHYPGAAGFRGRQMHTVDYRGPADLAGLRVVVVGGGTSAVQILAEVSEVAEATWVTRRPPVWREGSFTPELGRAAVGLVERAVQEGRPPGSVVSVTGLLVTPEVERLRARGLGTPLPPPDRVTATGLAWDDGRVVDADVILWCTGFRAALDHLAPLRLREPGGGIRMAGTQPVREPRLHLVGYGPSASTVGANRAGRAAAREIRSRLGRSRAA